MTNFGFEVDVRAVGEASNSGDCILTRFGDLNGHPDEFTLAMVDGGFSDDGRRRLISFGDSIVETAWTCWFPPIPTRTISTA